MASKIAGPSTPAHVRADLIRALRIDLIGPTEPDDAQYHDEVLSQAPSRWYLAGFLAPYEASYELRSDETATEGVDVAQVGNGDDNGEPDGASARKVFFPSSIGLSFLVPDTCDTVEVEVRWGDYAPEGDESEEGEGDGTDETGRPERWRRTQQESVVRVSTLATEGTRRTEVPDSDGLWLAVSVREVKAADLVPEGTRSMSVFLVNHRHVGSGPTRDVAYVFQTGLTVRSECPLVPRPNVRGRKSEDEDEKIAALQYRDVFEYAVGHNVSAVARIEGGECAEVSTTWVPTADVEKVVPSKVDGVELGMDSLSAVGSGDELREALGSLADEYGRWIEVQRAGISEADEDMADTADDLLHRAGIARQRIADGIEILAEDSQALAAFRVANRAIARAIRQRACHGKDDLRPDDVGEPRWRPFQLAFVLMNVCGVIDPSHADRNTVDLLFFPTGGGKTEAYLGLAAFALALRRMRRGGVEGAGVSVIMRYTLRLLTLDQLGRAATMICAMELEREEHPEVLGEWPFEIGLWVGQAATPNRIGKKGDGDTHSARARTIAFKNDSKGKPAPIPLENCPWCGTKFNKYSFSLEPDADNPRDLRVACVSRTCDFRRRKRYLPLLSVDEPIYRRLPAFVIATVDKFANLPWVGDTGMLLGGAERYDERGFYGPMAPHMGRRLESPLLPPELIIQDELHLISGPLGTMVGLYETVIDALSTVRGDGVELRPKIVASTATVRRAAAQIQALFGRTTVDIFPPPGPDRRDSFFAKTVATTEKHGRTYVGIAAEGRSAKVVLLRVYLTLLSAGQKAWAQGDKKSPDNPADPYMTLMGYFGSLRELGGSRRIVEDEVQARLHHYSRRRREGVSDKEGLFADRKIQYEPRELTSRVSTNEVAETKRRLELPFADKGHVDVALATNMISVGLDITRLGTMVVLGQPKSPAEYIQATSRVGRDDRRPGLVITLFNIHRARDRSHYERFSSWHESFYSAVEATSVTPFSPRAIDRGLAAITVALARHGRPRLTSPPGAARVAEMRHELGFVKDAIGARAEAHKQMDRGASMAMRHDLRERVEALLDSWEVIAVERDHQLQYQQREGGNARPLLRYPLETGLTTREQQFTAARSLRDVQPSVNIIVKRPDRED